MGLKQRTFSETAQQSGLKEDKELSEFDKMDENKVSKFSASGLPHA